jgi:predicted pyridoxine 5'-phosphate oxidase superfamily flavin-nucleotide-binding protein
MPAKPKQTISQQLNAAQVAITNSLTDPEIKAAVAQYGYTTARLNAGKALYEAALAAVNAQKSGRGDQKAATADLKAKEKDARDAYQAAAKVARAALSKEDLTTLGLMGKEPRGTAGFIQAGYTLFDNALDSGLLADFGYDEARIAAERDKIEAFDAANQAQEMAKGAAQQATQDQDAALAKMNDWVAQYLKIARVALRGKKQLLEKIGVTARTTKTKAQRAAPKKAAATRAAKKA